MIIFLGNGCSSLQTDNCPYIITNQYVSNDNGNEFFDYSGAFFSIHNKANKTIKKLTLCFSLFDENGEIISYGNGKLAGVFEGEIESGENKEIIISLDDVLGNDIEGGYRIDFVYISSITYTDGSVWQDYFGLYSL